MLKTAKVVLAIAVTAVAIPALAEEAKKPTTLDRTATETRDPGAVTKKTPEQVAAEKAAADKKRAEARKPATTPQEKAIERTGNETRDPGTVTKKTPEQLAKEKADKEAARKSATPAELEKAKKTSPGG